MGPVIGADTAAGTDAAVEARVRARRAIEALRAGVPNRDAVIALGSPHDHIEEQFRAHLERAGAAGTTGRSPAGFMVAGNFGTGKSHLLEYLRQLALGANFVVSKVVVSKETPLHDPVKLYRAAIRAASVPGRVGAALAQIAAELDFGSERYAEFDRWVRAPGAGAGSRSASGAGSAAELNQRFPATLYLYEHGGHDPELRDRVVSFWAGEPILVGEPNRALRQVGGGGGRPAAIGAVGQRELAYQRFRFAARLMLAAGFAGWVLLFDEVDLVGRYTFPQRAKSYAEMARWTGNLRGETYPGITSVLAITSAYGVEVLEARNDREAVPGRLRLADPLLADGAERGIRLIGKAMLLFSPSAAVVDRTHALVRDLHARAYGWSPPPAGDPGERLASTRMREYVRRWINEWDLKRLDPTYEPSIEVTPLGLNLAEDADLEGGESGEGDEGPRVHGGAREEGTAGAAAEAETAFGGWSRAWDGD